MALFDDGYQVMIGKDAVNTTQFAEKYRESLTDNLQPFSASSRRKVEKLVDFLFYFFPDLISRHDLLQGGDEGKELLFNAALGCTFSHLQVTLSETLYSRGSCEVCGEFFVPPHYLARRGQCVFVNIKTTGLNA